MDKGKRDFNKDAPLWDAKPERVKLVNDIADTLIDQIKPETTMDVLDFGCGTGLLSMRLIPFVHSVTGVDSSAGMLEVFQSKIEKQKLNNATTSLVDIEKGGILSGAYHLVTSSMTLHHIREIRPLLKQFHKILLPSGRIAVADLDLDDGKFHDAPEGVFHDGFHRAALRHEFSQAGFAGIEDRTAATVTRPGENGALREFTIFLMTGVKK